MSSLVLATTVEKRYWFRTLFPFAIIGMMGSAISFLRMVCNGNTRWGILIFLFIFFILKGNLLRYLNKQLVLFLSLYLFWCFLTSFWSDSPLLSFLKSGIYMVAVITFIRAGIEWVRLNPWQNALNYLWILVVVTLLAGFMGKYNTSSMITLNGGVELYQGLVRGSNMFGVLLAMSFPFLLWQTYQTWSKVTYRIILLFILVCLFYFLIVSGARAALLMTMLTLFFFLNTLHLNKKLLLLFMTIIVSVSATVAYPPLFDKVIKLAISYVYKSETSSVFKSRTNTWKQSYEGAVEGGAFGLGYGISYDAPALKTEFSLEYGLRSDLYGREKGNSQLAILEETGIVGGILYCLLLLCLTIRLIYLFSKIRDPHQRILIGIIIGTFFGMIIESLFENWWGSAGSQETIYFWILVGVARGLELTLLQKREQYHDHISVKA